MTDTYEVSKTLWNSTFQKASDQYTDRELKSKGGEDMENIKKSTGAGKGQGDERAKAGDVKEAGEKRADVVDSSAIPSEAKKEIAPTEGDAKEKKNPAGKADASTKGQGDERDKAGDTKEAGEKRATVEKSEDVEKCNEGSPMVAKKKKVAEIVKAWEADGRIHTFFGFLRKADPELAKELPVTPELWNDYMINHSKNVNKGSSTWNEISQTALNKSYADIKKFPKFGKEGKKEEPEKEEEKK